MNTETIQDQTLITTGERLRQARKNIGLNQQAVAKRLCLKLSTVRDIENDYVNPHLALTFLRGYIRSYARLVRIPEEELQPIITKQTLLKVSKTAAIRSFSLNKHRMKQNDLLLGFTWLILFIVVGLTGAWWWQSYQSQKKDIAKINTHSYAQLSWKDNIMQVPLNHAVHDVNQLEINHPINTNSNISATVKSLLSTPIIPNHHVSHETINNNILPVPVIIHNLNATKNNILNNNNAKMNNNVLVMSFTNDCWLEVFDANGKKLFRGMQHKNSKLNLTGQTPYKLKIGAPDAVEIKYQGKLVDLSQFVRANQIARLTITAQ